MGEDIYKATVIKPEDANGDRRSDAFFVHTLDYAKSMVKSLAMKQEGSDYMVSIEKDGVEIILFSTFMEGHDLETLDDRIDNGICVVQSIAEELPHEIDSL